MLPVANVWVTLHRVAAVGAGPMDSTRTGADGRYAFAFRAGPADSVAPVGLWMAEVVM